MASSWLANGTQIDPSQHPLGQLVPSQTHVPSWQRWPAAQFVHDPATQTATSPQQTSFCGTQFWPTQAWHAAHVWQAPPAPHA